MIVVEMVSFYSVDDLERITDLIGVPKNPQ